MSQFHELMNKIENIKKLTREISLADDEIQNLIYQSIDDLECCLDVCKNLKREVQVPFSRVFTEYIEYSEDDELMKTVIDKYKGYQKTFEDSGEKTVDLIEMCREKFIGIFEPVEEVKIEFENSYTKFKENFDILTKPLTNFIEGLDVEELKKKELSDKDKLKILKKLLNNLKETMEKYNKSLEGFNKEALKLFTDVIDTNNSFSGYIETKILEKVKDVPELMNENILSLSEIPKEINKFNKENTNEEKEKYYDKCLIEVLKMIKNMNEQINKIDEGIDSDFKNFNEKFDNGKNEIIKKANAYNKYIEETKKNGKIIMEIIDEIRKLFDLPQIKINIDDKNIEFPFNEYIKKLNIGFENIEEIKKEIKKYLGKIMDIFAEQINVSTLDILFIFDITESMPDILEEFRKSFIYLQKKIKASSPGIEVRFGFECYCDISDPENYYEIDFETDIEKIKKILDKMEAKGGEDDAEDVAGGFNKGLSLSWKSNARVAILIADAPGHGKQYHEDDVEDDFPDGDPNGLILEDLMKKYIENNINLCLTRIANYTDTMYKILIKTYRESGNNKKKHKMEIQLIEYETDEEYRKNNKNQIGDLVWEKAINIYNSYSKRERQKN